MKSDDSDNNGFEVREILKREQNLKCNTAKKNG